MGRLEYDRVRDAYVGPGLIIAGSVVRRVVARRVAQGLSTDAVRACTLQAAYWMLPIPSPMARFEAAGVA